MKSKKTVRSSGIALWRGNRQGYGRAGRSPSDAECSDCANYTDKGTGTGECRMAGPVPADRDTTGARSGSSCRSRHGEPAGAPGQAGQVFSETSRFSCTRRENAGYTCPTCPGVPQTGAGGDVPGDHRDRSGPPTPVRRASPVVTGPASADRRRSGTGRRRRRTPAGPARRRFAPHLLDRGAPLVQDEEQRQRFEAAEIEGEGRPPPSRRPVTGQEKNGSEVVEEPDDIGDVVRISATFGREPTEGGGTPSDRVVRLVGAVPSLSAGATPAQLIAVASYFCPSSTAVHGTFGELWSRGTFTRMVPVLTPLAAHHPR